MRDPFSERTWWFISFGVSFGLFLTLWSLWWEMNRFEVEPQQLTSEAEVDAFLEANWEDHRLGKPLLERAPTLKIKTGIFVQSLEFLDSTAVNLTGYIWQKYRKGIHDAVRPKKGDVGFILPDQIRSGGDIEPKEVYRFKNGEDEEVIGWYFESTLRQPFEYTNYPFDHTTVWIRLWQRHFDQNVVLSPDFDSYDSTERDDIFGIEKEIVLGTWERQNTYFDYKLSSYDTNFGIDDYIGRNGFPELRYNFVIKRKFENAFIVHLLPLFLVAALLFGALLTISNDVDLAQRHGFNTSQVIAACSALFFVVLLAHIQLREQFASSGLVYMEWFYFLMYAVLVLGSANTYLFAREAVPWLSVVHYRDNLIPKVLFWPLVFVCMIIVSLFHL